ncbi:MAG: hypothetical protein AAFO91_10450, partial [Bacteroidota bacterium]
IMCNNGWKISPSQTICYTDIDDDDSCYKYNGIYNKCIFCGSKSIPVYRYTRDTASDAFTLLANPESDRCVQMDYDFSRYRWKLYFDLKFYYTKDTGEMTAEIEFYETPEYEALSYSDGETESDLEDLHCIGNHQAIENCEITEGFFCVKCSPGYLSKDGYTCEEATIADCNHNTWSFANDREECLECPATHYLASPIQCTLRTESVDEKCFESELDSDDCNSCRTNYYPTGKTCTENTASNCLTKSRTANVCAECATDYDFNGQNPNNCVVLESFFNFQACTKLAEDKLSCTECQIGHYLKNGNCFKNTSTSCSWYSVTEDECTSCAPHQKLKGDNTGCEAKTASNCKTFSTTEDKCATCSAPFVLEGNDCVEKTNEKCLAHSSSQAVADKNKCGTCSRLHTLDADGQCVPKTAGNCLAFHETLNQCATCGTEYTFSTNSCNRKPDSKCSEFKASTD